VACGMFGGFAESVARMITTDRSYTPIPKNVSRYEKFYREVYVKYYDSVQHFMTKIAELNDAEKD